MNFPPQTLPQRLKAAVLVCALLFAATMPVARCEGDVADEVLLRECRRAITRWDADRAREIVGQLKRRHPGQPVMAALAAQAAFIAGRYQECREHLRILEDAGQDTPQPIAGISEELEELHGSFRKMESETFRLRWVDPADQVVAEYAPEVLEKALKSLSNALQWEHTGSKILVEIYPDLESFATATTLSMEEINTSGAVAICKFNRIMITSPRLYLQGYRWADTLAHELTHYVLIRKTGHDIPVWLHEGIAKYCETLWRNGGSTKRLTPMQATLLAEAREGNRYISFDRMHTSLVKLDSGEEVALAYAEVVSFIHFLRDVRGDNCLPLLIEQVAGGKDVQIALQNATGLAADRLIRRWKEWLDAQKLDRIPGLRVLPRKLSEGQDNTGRTADLSGVLPEEAYRFLRLGDMLRDQSRPGAAVMEYRKAIGSTEQIFPHLQVRLARMELRSRQLASAEQTLRKMARYYPDHFPLHLARAELERRRNNLDRAVANLETAAHINPFDPRVHQALAGLYAATGQPERRKREERVLQRLYKWLGW